MQIKIILYMYMVVDEILVFTQNGKYKFDISYASHKPTPRIWKGNIYSIDYTVLCDFERRKLGNMSPCTG